MTFSVPQKKLLKLIKDFDLVKIQSDIYKNETISKEDFKALCDEINILRSERTNILIDVKSQSKIKLILD